MQTGANRRGQVNPSQKNVSSPAMYSIYRASTTREACSQVSSAAPPHRYSLITTRNHIIIIIACFSNAYPPPTIGGILPGNQTFISLARVLPHDTTQFPRKKRLDENYEIHIFTNIYQKYSSRQKTIKNHQQAGETSSKANGNHNNKKLPEVACGG